MKRYSNPSMVGVVRPSLLPLILAVPKVAHTVSLCTEPI